jgi:hypothetical protein
MADIGDPKPDADAFEQQLPLLLDDGEDQIPREIPPDVPEADALDQGRVVPVFPEDER